MPHLKVIHLSPHYGGGVGAVVSSLSQTLYTEYKISSIWVSLEEPISPLPESLQPEVLSYHISPKLSSQHFTNLISSADIVICHYWNHPLLSYFLATYRFRDIPVIVWTHTSGSHPLNPIPNELLASNLRIIYSTSASSRLCPSHLGVARFEPQSIHSTRDLKPFSDLFRMREYVKNPGRILYAGTISRQKMHPDSVAIFRELAHHYYIDFLGEPTDSELLNALSGLKRVCFHGYQNSIGSYLLSADCLVYPLNRNHYGTGEQILLESLSSGLPAICIDNEPEQAIIQHLSTGILCPDSKTLISSVFGLMRDGGLIKAYSERANEDIKNRFSKYVMAEKFYKLISDLIRSKETMKGTVFKRHTSELALSAMLSATFPSHEYCQATSDFVDLNEIVCRYEHMKIPKSVLSIPEKGSPFQYNKYFPMSPSVSRICSMLQ